VNLPEDRLGLAFLDRHPAEAAQVAERDPEDAAPLLSALPPVSAAEVLQSMAPDRRVACLGAMRPDSAGATIQNMKADQAALLLRAMPTEPRERLLSRLPAAEARSFRNSFRFPPDSVGTLMDPQALALPADGTVREAFRRIRETSGRAHDELYVTDRTGRLLGRVPIRLLLTSDPGNQIGEIMLPADFRLPARSRIQVAATHPGWRESHTLPVVSKNGELLGTARFEVISRPASGGISLFRSESAETFLELGELWLVAASGFFAALTRLGSHLPDEQA